MRLLERHEVNEKRTIERRLEIEDGMRLAKKVDDLRKLRTAEEQALETFRTKTVSEVTEEIKTLVSQKSILAQEVLDLRRTRAELMVPLDAEWSRVNAEHLRLVGISDSLFDKQKALDDADALLQRKKSELSSREDEIMMKIAYLENLKSECEAASLEAEALIARSESAERSHRAFVESKSAHLHAREESVANAERSVNDRRIAQDARELELNARESAISDRYETLQRINNRKNNGRHSIKRPE